MRLLALDIGSSSVKAAVLQGGSFAAGPVRAAYPTTFAGVRAEIDPPSLLHAVAAAVAALGPVSVDLVGLAVLCPAWVAMDGAGQPLTPIVTHADRRSAGLARELERRVGRPRHLAIAGNRPFPGGIASTTWAWYLRHAPELMARAELVGQLSTFLHRTLTGVRVIDPSNASYLGVYQTCQLSGWSEELLAAVGGRASQLPEIQPADAVAGRLTPAGARLVGLVAGTPVLTGCVDGSAALLAAGAAEGGLRAGQLVNSMGSTDVLAIATDRPLPAPRLLTRALGTGSRWVCAATIASAGSALDWAYRTLFADQDRDAFNRLVAELAGRPEPGGVTFWPYLAGDRTAMAARRADFTGLTLATTRRTLLSAVIEALATAGADRLPRLGSVTTPLPRVYVTGGGAATLGGVFQRDWPARPDGSRWEFVPVPEATLRGLSELARTAE